MLRALRGCSACPSLAKSCTDYGWLMLYLFSGRNYNKDIQGASIKGGCSDRCLAKSRQAVPGRGHLHYCGGYNAIAIAERFWKTMK